MPWEISMQDTLFPLDEPDEAREKFAAFHHDNPRVFHELVRLARQLRAQGRKHYGIAGLFEVLRWHRALETTDEEFKLNNNYRAYYAREIMAACPDLVGFFKIREQR